jgi:hypothetical protein
MSTRKHCKDNCSPTKRLKTLSEKGCVFGANKENQPGCWGMNGKPIPSTFIGERGFNWTAEESDYLTALLMLRGEIVP